MTTAIPSTRAFQRILPIFPLPGTVFFPGTFLALTIFEPRYIEMVRDVTAGDGMIAIALRDEDSFYRTGTVGRISELELLEDGTFRVKVAGLERVSLTEVTGDTSYRQARVEARPEVMGTEDALMLTEARLELLASYGMLRSMLHGNEPLVLHQHLPFEAVVNTACSWLPIEASLRQRLLSEDRLIDRQRLSMDYFSRVIETLTWLQGVEGRGSSVVN